LLLLLLLLLLLPPPPLSRLRVGMCGNPKVGSESVLEKPNRTEVEK
jgi:hypothetical protein